MAAKSKKQKALDDVVEAANRLEQLLLADAEKADSGDKEAQNRIANFPLAFSLKPREIAAEAASTSWKAYVERAMRQYRKDWSC